MGMITRNTQVLFERAEVITYNNSQLAIHKILHDVLTVGCYCNFCLFVCLFFFFMVVRNVCITVDLANWVAPFPSQLNHVIVSLFQGSVLNLTGTAKG